VVTAICFLGTLFFSPFPAFAVELMSLTYNVGIGITAGFVLYPFCKVVSRRVGEIKPGAVGTGWVVAAVFCVLSLSVDESRKSSGFKMRTRVGWGLARSVSRSFLSR
jgi:xanthine/uracil/vitamin C permease (AzgA family)